MQKLSLKQTLTQKLSPQQIQFMKLLQVPQAAIERRVEAEIERNPTLEVAENNDELSENDDYEAELKNIVNIQDPLNHTSYTMQPSYSQATSTHNWQAPIVAQHTFHEQLREQLNLLQLNERQQKIGEQLIGNIEPDGYLRLDLDTVVNDLAFTQYFETNVDEVKAVLHKIQNFDPPGIGASNLQECLSIQLRKKKKQDAVHQVARKIVDQFFDQFAKKHYDQLMKKLKLQDPQCLKAALALITSLNPKPGHGNEALPNDQILYPDFTVMQQNGTLAVALNGRHTTNLTISRRYTRLVTAYRKGHKQQDKDTHTFLKQKLASAQWFVDAMQQRQQTLLKTMSAIVKLQYVFFIEGEASALKPMILKDVAKTIDMDPSTVSRIVNNKSAQTDFGVYPLKFFFSEAVITTLGKNVTSRPVKEHIEHIIANEDKQAPYSDDKICLFLKEKGYLLARRTVAKYRAQLHMPVARLRKKY